MIRALPALLAMTALIAGDQLTYTELVNGREQ